MVVGAKLPLAKRVVGIEVAVAVAVKLKASSVKLVGSGLCRARPESVRPTDCPKNVLLLSDPSTICRKSKACNEMG